MNMLVERVAALTLALATIVVVSTALASVTTSERAEAETTVCVG
jgi:hypothetical protein